MGFFGFGKKNKEKEQEKMKTGLEKTRTGFWGNILNTLTGSVIDDDMYDDLEEQLILADVGGEVAVRLVDKLLFYRGWRDRNECLDPLFPFEGKEGGRLRQDSFRSDGAVEL